MTKQILSCLLGLTLVAGSAMAQQSGSRMPGAIGKSQTSSGSENGETSPEREQMNALAASAYQMAFSAISRSGNFYPFAIYVEDGQKKSFAYNMKSKKEPPSPEKWFKHLFAKVRTKTRTSPNVSVAAVARMHKVEGQKKGKDGTTRTEVPGVWVLVDHRNADPVVAFMPLLPNEEGKHEPGKMRYSSTDNRLFPE